MKSEEFIREVDEDLRREIEKGTDLLTRCAGDVLRRGPKTVTQDALAVEAATMMEQHRISSVLVVPRPDDDAQRAQQQRHAAKLQRIKHLVGHHRSLTDDEAQALVDSPVGRQVEEMVRYSAVGTPDDVAAKLAAFAEHADADELIVASLAPDRDVWFQTLVNLAPAASSAPTAALVR